MRPHLSDKQKSRATRGQTYSMATNDSTGNFQADMESEVHFYGHCVSMQRLRRDKLRIRLKVLTKIVLDNENALRLLKEEDAAREKEHIEFGSMSCTDETPAKYSIPNENCQKAIQNMSALLGDSQQQVHAVESKLVIAERELHDNKKKYKLAKKLLLAASLGTMA